MTASGLLNGPTPSFDGDRAEFVEKIRQALYASKIVSYTQGWRRLLHPPVLCLEQLLPPPGYMLLREASKVHNWNLNFGAIALMWRGGCIIRSVFLGKIKEAFDKEPELQNLLLDGFFHDVVHNCQQAWRDVIVFGVMNGVPLPTFSTALAFFDG